MGDVSHTHPETRETFGTVYRRGPAVTDGGAAGARGGTRTDGEASTTIADVDHEPPYSDSVDLWSRGSESASGPSEPRGTDGTRGREGDGV